MDNDVFKIYLENFFLKETLNFIEENCDYEDKNN
jgi:hypothetical protein